jgi:hypothetical protein
LKNLSTHEIFVKIPNSLQYSNERRMAPMSRELSGVVFPHDHFGNHLDSCSKTMDDDLEIQNFEEAGEVLASIWNDIDIDKYPVVARYMFPPANNTVIGTKPAEALQEWRAVHMFAS